MKKNWMRLVLVLGLILIIGGAIMGRMLNIIAKKPPTNEYYKIPTVELPKERQKTVYKNVFKYYGHPDLVLTNSGEIMNFFPSGHGRGAIVTMTTGDKGKTWSQKNDTPPSWKDSQETPTVYKLDFVNGKSKIILFSGNPGWGKDGDGFHSSVSSDDGKSFTEFKKWYSPMEGVVAMSSLTRMKENGVFIDKWLCTFHNNSYVNFKTYLTFDSLGNEILSQPEPLLAEHVNIESKSGMCELEIVRSPDGRELMLLARANNKITNSMVSFSVDEGNTWTTPVELPDELTGDRHKAEYDPITGKLLISFREIRVYPPSDSGNARYLAGNWAGWVGSYADIKAYAEGNTAVDYIGDFRVVFAKEYTGRGDCGYAGVVVDDKGVFTLSSYGIFTASAMNPYVISLTFTMQELIQLKP